MSNLFDFRKNNLNITVFSGQIYSELSTIFFDSDKSNAVLGVRGVSDNTFLDLKLNLALNLALCCCLLIEESLSEWKFVELRRQIALLLNNIHF